MSSRKKRRAGEDHGSSRNLDGRRLRTVTEAKALAEYLATKPEMDRREKEARRKRWEEVVEAAERTEAQLRAGNKGRVDGAWVESKEETAERTREAVLAALREGGVQDAELFVDGQSESGSDAQSDEDDDEAGPSSAATTPPEAEVIKGKGIMCFGFDDDDEEFLSDDEEAAEAVVVKGKGKGKAS